MNKNNNAWSGTFLDGVHPVCVP